MGGGGIDLVAGLVSLVDCKLAAEGAMMEVESVKDEARRHGCRIGQERMRMKSSKKRWHDWRGWRVE